MKALTVVVISLLAVLSIVALLNWTAISTPGPLSVGFTTITAPLGLIMLVGAGLLTVALLALVVYQQAVGLADARRASRELRVQRDLADKAEASRFTDLRSYLAAELKTLDDKLERILQSRAG